MEDGQTHDTTNELEVVQVLRVDTGVGVDLESVVVMCRIFKQTIEGIKHLVGKQEEEFSGETSVIKTVFTIELDHQSLLEVGSALPHDLVVGILENMRSAHLDVTLTTNNAERWLRPEVDELATEIALVLRHVLIQ